MYFLSLEGVHQHLAKKELLHDFEVEAVGVAKGHELLVGMKMVSQADLLPDKYFY